MSRRPLLATQRFWNLRAFISSAEAIRKVLISRSYRSATNFSPCGPEAESSVAGYISTKYPFGNNSESEEGRLPVSGSTISPPLPIERNLLKNKCRSFVNQKRTFCSSTSRPDDQTETSRQTYDADEVEKFSKLSEDWWDEYGHFQALHSMNALRVPLIRDGMSSGADNTSVQHLKGLKIVDVGCGGGILSEPLARLGAEVTGIDASLSNAEAAERHSKLDPDLEGKVSYKCCLVEELAEEAGPSFDGLVASEILEHVADPKSFIQACCNLVVPGGSIFVTTMNRTQLAYGLAVFAAERIFRIVPEGAHDWNKFVSPEELTNFLRQNGAEPRLVHGMILNPFTLRWSWCSDTSMNYAIHAVKHHEQS